MRTTTVHSAAIAATGEEREQIRAAVAGLRHDRAERHSGEGLLEAGIAGRLLPKRFLRDLLAFRRWSAPSGTLVFRGLPVNPDLPPTPSDGQPVAGEGTWLSEAVLTVFMSQLGDPIAYADEKGGDLIQEICPIRGHEERQENSGSDFLEFHTENGFHPFKPDFVGLICLRPDHDRNVETRTSSIRRLLPLLPAETVAALRRPTFRILPSSSFGGGEDVVGPIAVITGSPDLPHMVVDCNAMVGADERSKRALAELAAKLPLASEAIVADTGDLLVIDNRVAAHARSAMLARYDGRDRWLQRMSVVSDFRRSQVARGHLDHVCGPLGTIALGVTSNG
jgi:L-asparagine oxygenase